jgi:hypothetical protein
MITAPRAAGLAALLVALAAWSVVPAGARTSRSVHTSVVIVDGPQTAAKVPAINILGEGLGAHFKPDSVRAALSSSSQPCTASDESLTVTNKSSLDEDMIEGGSDFVNLPPGGTAAVCLYANGSSSFIFGLANDATAHTLDVTVK